VQFEAGLKESDFSFIHHGGEVGKLIPRLTWHTTAAGSPFTSSQSLRITLCNVLNCPLPVALYWGQDFICFYNDAFIPILEAGLHPKMLGKPGKKYWPKNLSDLQPLVERAFSGELLIHAEEQPVSNHQVSQIERTFLSGWSVSPVFDDNGRIGGVLLTGNKSGIENRNQNNSIESRTAGLRLQEKPEANVMNLRNIIFQAPIAMCILKGEEYVVDIANERMFELWGKHSNKLSLKLIFEGLSEAKNQDFEELLARVYHKGETMRLYDVPVNLIRKGVNETVYVNFVYEPFREENGKISGVMVVAVEVTEQFLLRKRNEEAEEKARLAISSAHLGTYEIDLVTDEIKTDERFKEIWGVDSDIPRSEYASRIHPVDIDSRSKAHEESVKSGNLHYEARVIWHDKSERWVKVKGKVLHDAEGKPSSLLGIIQDITDQKSFAEKLQKQVKERTEEYLAINEELVATNEELRQANDNLLKANNELQEFAYVASHDLQEPLRKIQIFSNILSDRFSEHLNAQALAYLGKISTSATRMSDLIKDLLDYARLSERESLFKKMDLNQILKQVLDDFEVLILQRNIVVQSETLPVIECIPFQMNQLFYNLIGNAIKFSKKGHPGFIKIRVRFLSDNEVEKNQALKKDSSYCELFFQDNGIGFSPQYAEQIFAIFQRLNDKSSYGGYGIGLALCRKIVHNHRGLIYAKGKENEGATFVVILPVSQQ
jgi:PAS domain S-box-containing protein